MTPQFLQTMHRSVHEVLRKRRNLKQAALAALGVVALFFGLASIPLVSVASPAPTPTQVPMGHPNFASMMFLTGPWTCTQLLRGKQRPDTSTTTIGMDGNWMVTQDTAPAFDQYRSYAIHGTSYMTYDSSIKQWVQVGADSAGGYGISSSPGWQGNTISWTTKNLDGSSGSDVMTKISDTETSDNSTGTDSTGKVTKTTIHCTKSAS
jgi:hypothetical protein